MEGDSEMDDGKSTFTRPGESALYITTEKVKYMSVKVVGCSKIDE